MSQKPGAPSTFPSLGHILADCESTTEEGSLDREQLLATLSLVNGLCQAARKSWLRPLFSECTPSLSAWLSSLGAEGRQVERVKAMLTEHFSPQVRLNRLLEIDSPGSKPAIALVQLCNEFASMASLLSEDVVALRAWTATIRTRKTASEWAAEVDDLRDVKARLLTSLDSLVASHGEQEERRAALEKRVDQLQWEIDRTAQAAAGASVKEQPASSSSSAMSSTVSLGSMICSSESPFGVVISPIESASSVKELGSDSCCSPPPPPPPMPIGLFGGKLGKIESSVNVGSGSPGAVSSGGAIPPPPPPLPSTLIPPPPPPPMPSNLIPPAPPLPKNLVSPVAGSSIPIAGSSIPPHPLYQALLFHPHLQCLAIFLCHPQCQALLSL